MAVVRSSRSPAIGPSCVVIPSLEIGGAERQIVQLLPALREAGYPHFVYTLTHPGPWAEALRDSGIEVVAPPGAAALAALPSKIRRVVGSPISATALVRAIVSRRAGLVHHVLPLSYLVGAPCAALAGVTRQIMNRRNTNDHQALYPRIARLERRYHRHMHALLGNCKSILGDLLTEGAPPERLALVYNGVDLTRFSRLPGKDQARGRFGIPNRATVVLCLSSLSRRKGHTVLLSAFAEALPRLSPDALLVCAGRDDGMGASLEQLTVELGLSRRVRWLGSVDDVASLLSAADMLVSSAHHEGISNSILEAMAARVPVVATEVGGTPEIIRGPGEGILVPASDRAALANAIVTLASNSTLRREIATAAYARVRESFSMESNVGRYVAIYEAVFAGTPLHDELRA